MLYIDVFMYCMTHIPDESTPAEFVTTEQGISNDIFTRWSVTHIQLPYEVVTENFSCYFCIIHIC